MAANSKDLKGQDTINDTQRLALLVCAANKDEKKLAPLREFIAKHPDLCERVGILGQTVITHLIGKLAGGQGSQEMFRSQLEGMLRKLGIDEASPIEELMIKRIGMCWLRLMVAESASALVINESYPLKQCEQVDRELSRASNRFIQACESLSRLRILKQMEKAAKARADILDAQAGNARMQKSQSALRLLKAASQGD